MRTGPAWNACCGSSLMSARTTTRPRIAARMDLLTTNRKSAPCSTKWAISFNRSRRGACVIRCPKCGAGKAGSGLYQPQLLCAQVFLVPKLCPLCGGPCRDANEVIVCGAGGWRGIPPAVILPISSFLRATFMVTNRHFMTRVLLLLLSSWSLALTAVTVVAETDSANLECQKSATFLAPIDSPDYRKYAPDKEVEVLHLALDVTPNFKQRTVQGRRPLCSSR